MHGLLKYPEDVFQKSWGLNQLWYEDATDHAAISGNNQNSVFLARHSCIIKKTDPNSTFSFRVPLKHIFGFCDE